MDRIRFITDQSKQILFIDLTNCGGEEVIEVVSEVQPVVTAHPRKSVLTLTDLTGAEFSRGAVTRMKEVAVFDRPYVKRAALVGAQSLPKVFYEALNVLPAGIPQVQDAGRKQWTGWSGKRDDNKHPLTVIRKKFVRT